jgi:tetratricopeptide (TPR) repeat protein
MASPPSVSDARIARVRAVGQGPAAGSAATAARLIRGRHRPYLGQRREVVAMLEDKRGLALTTASAEAVAAFDTAVERYLEYRLDTFEHVKRALAADPGFVMGHCLKGSLVMLMGTSAVHGLVAETLAALASWHAGDLLRACAVWDGIVAAHPHDLLAMRLMHFTQFWMGRDRALRNGVAMALPAWDEAVPGFGYVLAMHAFGLEECGDMEGAERAGRRAVALNPDDLWGVHAVAHVLEMQGRLAEGAAWLRPPADGWADRNAMKGHLWWHAALFPLEQGRHDDVLALYDRAVRPGEKPFYLDLQNAAALLARLELRGVDVGDRWRELAGHAEVRVDDHAILFTDLHNVMALARGGERGAAEALVASLERFAGRPDDYEAALVRPLVAPVAHAILAFCAGEPGTCVDLLLPLRHDLQPMGGSHTQRDVFHQLLLEAAIRAGRLDSARALAAERVTLRPASVHNWRRYAHVMERLGRHADAALALARAEVAGRG